MPSVTVDALQDARPSGHIEDYCRFLQGARSHGQRNGAEHVAAAMTDRIHLMVETLGRYIVIKVIIDILKLVACEVVVTILSVNVFET